MRGLKFSHNARLGRLVDDGYRELEKATSRDDLFAIIDTFESFPGPKTFQPTLGLGSLVSGALLILLSLIHELAYAEKRVEVNYNTERARDECKEVIHHFKRYSLIFDFQGLHGLTIRTHAAGILSDRRVWLDTGDSVFDQLFRLSGDSLLECETLLKNDLLGLFIELESFLTRPSLEFSEKGQLCLSFDDDLLKPAIEEDLSLPAALRIKLEHGTATSRFIEVLEWVERLQKQVNTITPSA
jgi:hypothetical protein